MEDKKIKVGSLIIKGKNLIEILALIEIKDKYPKDVVFFTIRENLSNVNQIKMKLTSLDLRDFAIALGDLYRDNVTDYIKSTKYPSSMVGQFNTKKIELKIVEEALKDSEKKLKRYYVNVYQNKNKISLSLNKINIRSFIEQCRHLATKLEEKLFIEQSNKFESSSMSKDNDD